MKDGRGEISYVFIQIVVGNVGYFGEEIPFPSWGRGEAAGSKEGFAYSEEVEVGLKEVKINKRWVKRIGRADGHGPGCSEGHGQYRIRRSIVLDTYRM
jgi:hypothetical protein